MRDRTVTLIGATGLIGGHLLELLQNEDEVISIRVLSRRPVDFNYSKVSTMVIDFGDENAFRSGIAGSDAVFCAVGTTQKKVKGDKTAYRKVDFDIPVNAAKYCEMTGCPQFLLVSSIGASSVSSNFYLKLKGEVEDEIRKLKIPSVSVFRPSMLMGKRQEFRFGEIIAKALTVPFSILFPSRYKPVRGRQVAESMIAASRKGIPGFHVYHYSDMV